MKRLQFAITILLALTTCVCSAQQKKLNRELAHLPPAVRKAIRAKVGDAKLDGIEKNTDDGEVSYDVGMVVDGKSRGFTVDDNGALLDEEVFLAELPPAVQRTIQMHSSNATIDEIDKSVEDGETSYDVEIERNGNAREFTVSGDGELLDEQVLPGELPPAVRQTVLKQAGNGVLGEIDKSVDDGETNYDVEVTVGGKSRSFTVGATGTLLDKEVFLAELPPALQAAIGKEGGADGGIHQCFDDGEVSYDVEVGEDRTVSFDSDGKIFSVEQNIRMADAPEAVQKQVASLVAGGKCLGISKITEDNEISYAVDVKTGGVTKTVSLGPDGEVLPDDEK